MLQIKSFFKCIRAFTSERQFFNLLKCVFNLLKRSWLVKNDCNKGFNQIDYHFNQLESLKIVSSYNPSVLIC